MGYYANNVTRSDDEICHFKYIDRYKKNGEWVYVYENAKNKAGNLKTSLKTNLNTARVKARVKVRDKLGLDEKARYENASKIAEREAMKKGATSSNLESNREMQSKRKTTEADRKTFNKYMMDDTKQTKIYKKALANKEAAKKEYYKTPRGKVAQVAEGVNNAANKINNAVGSKYNSKKDAIGKEITRKQIQKQGRQRLGLDVKTRAVETGASAVAKLMIGTMATTSAVRYLKDSNDAKKKTEQATRSNNYNDYVTAKEAEKKAKRSGNDLEEKLAAYEYASENLDNVRDKNKYARELRRSSRQSTRRK